MKLAPRLLMLLLGSALVSCGDDRPCQIDAALLISSFELSCWQDRGHGECSDEGTAATCHGTDLSCPSGYILGSKCVCKGPPPAPSCTCVDGGWSCPPVGGQP